MGRIGAEGLPDFPRGIEIKKERYLLAVRKGQLRLNFSFKMTLKILMLIVTSELISIKLDYNKSVKNTWQPIKASTDKMTPTRKTSKDFRKSLCFLSIDFPR